MSKKQQTREEWLRHHPKSTRRGGRPQIPMEIGTRVGILTVLGPAPVANRRSQSLCVCDCGKITVKSNNELRKRRILSCGCMLHSAHMKHGGAIRGRHERLWRIFHGIKQRCGNPKFHIFRYYGGRGITICKEWEHDYAAFRDWAMSHGYEPHLTIDRIDVNKGYEPSNCRWVTMREQCLNKRNTLFIDIDGVKKRVFEWCELFGIPEKLARSRIGEGKTGREIFAERKRGVA